MAIRKNKRRLRADIPYETSGAFPLSQLSTPSPTSISFDAQAGVTTCTFTGAWTVQTIHLVEATLRQNLRTPSGAYIFSLKTVTKLDTAGALLMNEVRVALEQAGSKCSVKHLTAKQQDLLERSQGPIIKAEPKKPRAPFLLEMLNTIGYHVSAAFLTAGQLIGFLGHFLASLGFLIFHPRQIRWTSLVFHMEQTGLRAVPIVALLTFLIGMVVAYMGAEELARFGAQVFAVRLLEVTILREMAVLITAIVVAGRSSSSFTAQIGAMVANEEIAAMRSMGLEPMLLLVVPRVAALMITLPLLVFLADGMALLGGATAIWYSMDLSFASFLVQFHEIAQLNNFFVGIIKTPFFALAIGIVGCFQGFQATSSAESVGFLTTVAVVEAIFSVILLDALFAIFFTTIGI